MIVTLDDVSFLSHPPIEDHLLDHDDPLSIPETVVFMVELIYVDLTDAAIKWKTRRVLMHG